MKKKTKEFLKQRSEEFSEKSITYLNTLEIVLTALALKDEVSLDDIIALREELNDALCYPGLKKTIIRS